MIARERLPVGRGNIQSRGVCRESRAAEVVAHRSSQLDVERRNVRAVSGGQQFRGVEVVARERLPVGRAYVRVCDRQPR